MPLFTDDIEQARAAYGTLEARAVAAEEYARALEAILDAIQARMRPPVDDVRKLKQALLDSRAENAGLRELRLSEVVPRLPLRNFIASLGTAASIGEATMPDRRIPSVAMTLQGYYEMSDADINLRLHQPELGQSLGLAATSFELARIPPKIGAAALPGIYQVLEDAQNLYSNPFWNRFEAEPRVEAGLAQQIVIDLSHMLVETQAWTFAYLCTAIADLAARMRTLATLAASQGAPASDYLAAVEHLAITVDTLRSKTVPVAADVAAIMATFYAANKKARSLLS